MSMRQKREYLMKTLTEFASTFPRIFTLWKQNGEKSNTEQSDYISIFFKAKFRHYIYHSIILLLSECNCFITWRALSPNNTTIVAESNNLFRVRFHKLMSRSILTYRLSAVFSSNLSLSGSSPWNSDCFLLPLEEINASTSHEITLSRIFLK